MKLNHIPIVLITLILSSCGQYDLSRKLKDVESYINDYPDSALHTISSIDINRNTSERNRAHHALLHAMAMDKCFIDVKDDSLAKTASDYYGRFREHTNKTLSLYYLGKAYLYNGEDNKAILELTRAEEAAGKDDSLYLGMIKMAQAAVYSNTYNSVEALNCITEAIDIYKSLSAERYYRIAKLKQAQTYSNLMQYDKASQIYTELLEYNTIDKDIYAIAIKSLAFLLTVGPEQDYQKAVSLYETAEENFGSEYFDITDRWALAYAKIASGFTNDIIIPSDDEDSGTYFSWKYRIAKVQGNTDLALSLLEKYVETNEIEVSQALKQSIAVTQRDYYESQKEAASLKVRSRNLLIVIILVSAILVAVIISLFVVGYIKRQKEEKEKYIQYIEEVSRQLKLYERENITDLKAKYIDIYKTKFETLGRLCDQYIHSQGRSDKEKFMYRKVMEMVNELKSDPHSRKRFEDMLNHDLNNVMKNLRNDFPRFKEVDFIIFSYMAVGFDATTISNLTGESINNIYTRKSRIRQKINDSNVLYKGTYLQFLD